MPSSWSGSSVWRDFLDNRGAEFAAGRVEHYGSLKRELAVSLSGNIICDLSHYTLLAIHGDDAESFLHSQFINDVTTITSGHSHLNGYCNAKGRMIASFRLFRRDETFYLQLPANMRDILVKRLLMYRLRSKVTIEDVTNGYAHIGFSGKTAVTALSRVLDQLPEQVDDVITAENHTVIRVPGTSPSFEIYADADTMKSIWQKLDVDAAPAGAAAWELLDVLAGIPCVLPDTTEAFVPQMLNYQSINGLSFKKGCYPGQEIVARMHYLGKLKKRCFLMRVDGDDAIPPLTEVLSDKSSSSNSVGQVVNSVQHPDGYQLILAVIKISEMDAGSSLHITDDRALLPQELPYEVVLGHES